MADTPEENKGPPSMDDMMREAIASKREDGDGLFAVAWSLNKVAEALERLNANYTVLQAGHNNVLQQIANKPTSEAFDYTARNSIQRVVERLANGQITIKLS